MQYRGLRVRVQNGSATVRQVWKAFGTLGGVGGFGAAEAISWPGGGVGVYVTDNGSSIQFYRTSGPNPAVGTVISGASDGSIPTFTITSFPAENLSATAPVAAYPALFSTTGGTQGAILSGDEFFISGEPIGVVSATIGSDSFDLTSAWGGTTLTNVEAVVNRDRTSNFGWPLVEQGSRIPFAVIKEALRQIDADVQAGGGGGGGSPPTSWTTLTLQSPWVVSASESVSAQCRREPATQSTRLKGLIWTNGSTVSTNSVIVASGGIPSTMRPLYRVDFAFIGERFSIETNGSIIYRTEDQTNVIPGKVALSCTFSDPN